MRSASTKHLKSQYERSTQWLIWIEKQLSNGRKQLVQVSRTMIENQNVTIERRHGRIQLPVCSSDQLCSYLQPNVTQCEGYNITFQPVLNLSPVLNPLHECSQVQNHDEADLTVRLAGQRHIKNPTSSKLH